MNRSLPVLFLLMIVGCAVEPSSRDEFISPTKPPRTTSGRVDAGAPQSDASAPIEEEDGNYVDPRDPVYTAPACASGTQCGDECVDTNASPMHCGACGHTCASGQCTRGACVNLTCTPGTSEICYSGPSETANVGACTTGRKTCNAEGTAWGPCSGERTPKAERCGDTTDDNCNSVVNEDCTYSLTVELRGTGTGTVVSSGGGINCGANCTTKVPEGDLITLTATPAAGNTYAWSGACTGTGTCTVTMSQAKKVYVTFSPPPPPPPCNNARRTLNYTPTTQFYNQDFGGCIGTQLVAIGPSSCSPYLVTMKFNNGGWYNLLNSTDINGTATCYYSFGWDDHQPHPLKTVSYTLRPGASNAGCTITTIVN